MEKTILSTSPLLCALLVPLLLVACLARQTPAATPSRESPSPPPRAELSTPTPDLAFEPTPTALPRPSASTWTFTPRPTSTPSPGHTLLPSPTATPEPQRIRFAPGATSATVNGTLQPLGANRYILGALAGQTLIVDIAAPTPIVLSVSGENGTVLVLERMDQTPHWEGRLPSAQDYLLELVSSGTAIEYHMTVTIPRLTAPTPAVSSTYQNREYGFEVQVPSDFGRELTCPTAAGIQDRVISFRLVGDPYYAGTNLLDACVTIGVDRSQAARSTCLGPRDPHEKHRGQEEINGIVFSKLVQDGVAAGHIHNVTIYRTLHADACYEVVSFLRYYDAGVYAPGTVSEFDRVSVTNRLRQVVMTYRFTDAQTTLSAQRRSPYSPTTENEGIVYHRAAINPHYRSSPPFGVRHAALDWELVPGDSSGRFDQLQHRDMQASTLWLQVGPSQASRITTVKLGGNEGRTL